MSIILAVIQSMRIPFLVLSPVSVFLGVCTVLTNDITLDRLLLVLVVLGALLAHVSVNTFNEYLDYKSGLDLATIKTPFSGGSGALPDNPKATTAVLMLAIFSLLATLAIGLFFVTRVGTELVPLGLTGLLLIVTYTRTINRYPWLCLVAPGLGFGFLMVMGTNFILSGEYSTLAMLAGAVPFFLANNLLLLNQYPDIDADRLAGRNHLPIAYGTSIATLVYGLFVFAYGSVIIVGILTGIFPVLSLVSLLPLPLALIALKGAKQYGKRITSKPGYLAANVIVAIMTPLLLGVSLIVA